MRIFGRLAIACVVVFALLQLVRPSIPAKPATAEVEAPPQVRHILNKDCYSCHSDERRLAWFDQIVPAYWLVRYDVLSARARLNFSTLGAKPPAAQKATLYEAVNMVQLGAMPLPRFLQLHPDARVTPDELATMKAYLAPWTSIPSQSASTPAGVNAESGNTQAPVSLAAVQPELDGFPFDPDFENWKPLSFTDRGDNYTFRFVLGNAIACRPRSREILSHGRMDRASPKLRGSRNSALTDLIHPGKFVQVELMLKNAQQYKSTEGWGWGRWRGADLKPYGKDAGFVHECTGCHAPVRGNDFVYTLPMTNAQVPGNEIVNNQAAGLSVNLPYQPLGWNAITMYVDPTATHHVDAFREQRGHADCFRSWRRIYGCANVFARLGVGACYLGTTRRSSLVRRAHSGSSAVCGVCTSGNRRPDESVSTLRWQRYDRNSSNGGKR